MKVQTVTAYRVSQLQRYGVTVRGNVTSVHLPLDDGPGPVSRLSQGCSCILSLTSELDAGG
jgi:hypothetical protein